mgnify:CR=1 FL=1
MKKTENTKATTNNDLQIVGKKFVFVINNDENNEKTDIACQSFREWLKTPQNSKKYVNKYGIVGGDWQIDISDVTEFIHIGTAYDNLSGGDVDIIYIKFENTLLNRIVYIDNRLRTENRIPLPIGDNVKYVPFDFKYVNGTRKRATKKQSITTEKTNSTTTPTKTKTPTKTTAEKVNK